MHWVYVVSPCTRLLSRRDRCRSRHCTHEKVEDAALDGRGVHRSAGQFAVRAVGDEHAGRNLLDELLNLVPFLRRVEVVVTRGLLRSWVVCRHVCAVLLLCADMCCLAMIVWGSIRMMVSEEEGEGRKAMETQPDPSACTGAPSKLDADTMRAAAFCL